MVTVDKDKIGKVANRVLVLTGTTILMLISLEIALRIFLWHFASPPVFNTYASVNQLQNRYQDAFTESISFYVPHRYLGYALSPNYREQANHHNSLGYRGDEIIQPKPEGVFRIVCIGGSTTYSVADNDYHFSYPYLLQEALHSAGYSQVEVVNAGVHGYTSLESLINLQIRILDLQPDMIIIYDSVNDVESRLVWPPEAYRSDYSGSRTLKLETIRMPSLLQYSTTFRILGIRLGFFDPHTNLDWHLIHRPGTYYGDEYSVQNRQERYPSGIFSDVSAEEMLRQNSPIYFERNLRNMLDTAVNHNITPMLLTFAYFSGVGEDTSRTVITPEYQMALNEQNEVIRDLASEYDVLFFDLAEAMPDDMANYTDGQHFTREGNQTRVDYISRYIIASKVLDD